MYNVLVLHKRNWRLEASNNSKNGLDGDWITLLKHINDKSLNHIGATHTWSIPTQNVNNKSFTQFRIFQLGLNSNKHYFLALSGFEIFGNVNSCR